MAKGKWKMANGAERRYPVRSVHFPFSIFHLPSTPVPTRAGHLLIASARLRETNRELFLRACEETMDRMLVDRNFSRPDRALFRDVRVYFSVSCQLRVSRK